MPLKTICSQAIVGFSKRSLKGYYFKVILRARAKITSQNWRSGLGSVNFKEQKVQ